MKVRIGVGLGVSLASGSFERFAGLVDDLERLRFDSLWLSERATGRSPDPMIGLAFAAGRTKKLKLGTSVQVLSGRNPALLAKAWASLDQLSGGRTLPAFGLGIADDQEHQAFRIARGDRAGWFDEALPLIRRFWGGEAVDHDGERFHYDGLTIQPTPVQQLPDVWLGGAAPSELRRVGRLADGWLPSFSTPAQVADGRPVVEAAADAAGRQIDPEHFGALVTYVDGDEIPDLLARAAATRRPGTDPAELIPTGVKALRARLEDFVERGFSKLVVVPVGDPASWSGTLGELADEVLPLQT